MARSGLTPSAICIVLLLIACAPPAAAAPVIPLTNDSAPSSYPFWSPDGKTLLFLSADAGESDLWTINADGTGRMRLTEGGRILPGLLISGYGADWSDDGKRIVYTSCLYDNAAIWEAFAATAEGGPPAINGSAMRKEADLDHGCRRQQ